MSLIDEAAERRRRDGLDKPTFYLCPRCQEISESYQYLDQCPSCPYKGELTEASSRENAEKIKDFKPLTKSTGQSQATELDISKKLFGKEVLDGIQKREHDEQQTFIAQQLTHGMGFLAAAGTFHKIRPFVYDERNIWSIWNQEKRIYERVDKIDMMNIIRQALVLYGDVTVKKEGELLRALQQTGRAHKPKPLPLNCVQFQGMTYDIKTGETQLSTPDYFSTNNIPWELGESEDTPVMDQLFTEWVGANNVKTLYEILAYCTYRDYPLHIIVVLNGCGRNGKGRFLALLTKFIGDENIVATDFERLTENRFETFNLWRKNVAVMGETNFSILTQTSLIKRLSGQDPIPYEGKGLSTFTDRNYAKIVIATNSLPSSDDNSEGFYRRWLIIDFPHEFPEGKDILERIPEKEYHNLALKVARILPELLSKGTFTGQGSISDRRQKYIEVSNPLSVFLEKFCVRTNGDDDYLRYNSVYTKYTQWLTSQKKRKVKTKEFTTALENEGIEIRRTTVTRQDNTKENGTFVFGLKFKETILEFEGYTPQMHDMQEMQHFQLYSTRIETELQTLHNSHITHTGAINAVYDSGLESSNAEFPSKPDVLEAIKKSVVPLPFEDLEKLFPGEVRLNSWVALLKEEGAIFEPRPGFLKVLE